MTRLPGLLAIGLASFALAATSTAPRTLAADKKLSTFAFCPNGRQLAGRAVFGDPGDASHQHAAMARGSAFHHRLMIRAGEEKGAEPA